MTPLRFLGLCALIASAGCATNTSASGQATQAELLKKWALCKCLAKAFPKTAVADDASKTAAAYLEFGTAPIESYESLKVLADDYLKRPYSGSVPSNYDTMKCIDFYESGELEKAARDIAARYPAR